MLNGEQQVMSCPRNYTAKNGHPFVIRLATAANKQEIISNINAICAEQIYLYTDTFVCTRAWEKLLAESVDWENRQVLLVATANDMIIGHGRLLSLWFGAKGQHVVDLGIALLKPWREIGIGAALVICLLDWARTFSYLKVSVDVIATNHCALNLFHKMGFVEEGRRKNHLRVNNHFCDEILLGYYFENVIPGGGSNGENT